MLLLGGEKDTTTELKDAIGHLYTVEATSMESEGGGGVEEGAGNAMIYKDFLKVVGNQKVRGSGMCQTVPIWLGPRRSSSFLSQFCHRLRFYLFPFPPQ